MTTTKEIRLAVLTWYKARKELGNLEDQARKHGVSTRTIHNIIARFGKESFRWTK